MSLFIFVESRGVEVVKAGSGKRRRCDSEFKQHENAIPFAERMKDILHTKQGHCFPMNEVVFVPNLATIAGLTHSWLYVETKPDESHLISC